MAHLSLAIRQAQRIKRRYGDVRAAAGHAAAIRSVGKFITHRLGDVGRYMAVITRASIVRDDVARHMKSVGDDHALIAIRITGGIGDLIVAARYVRDLLARVEPAEFDIYFRNPSVASWVFARVPGLRAVYSDFLFDKLRAEYPAALWVSQFVECYPAAMNARALRDRPLLTQVLATMGRARRPIERLIEQHPFLDGYLAQVAVFSNRSRADFVHGMSGIAYGGDRLELDSPAEALARFGLEGKKYITVHNGFDPQFTITGRTATKCYRGFDDVVRHIKAARSDFQVVQVGITATSMPIADADVDLLDRTSLREVAAIVRGAALHIDGEGGLVHIAAALGTRSCVVFGPTPANYFGYPANINLTPKECGGCWWVKETWMERCPREFTIPRCMESHSPLDVANAALGALAGEATPCLGAQGTHAP